MLRLSLLALNCLLLVPHFITESASFCIGAEVPAVPGWQVALPTPGTHQASIEFDPTTGEAKAKITGGTSENRARGALIQEFIGPKALRPDSIYRYSVRYRAPAPPQGYGQVIVDSYTAEGEKSHKSLVSRKLEATNAWQTIAGEITVPKGAVRVRMLLYLQGAGTILYDDAFLGLASEGSANLLANAAFDPPGSARFDLAPEKRSGNVTFSAEFDNGTLGAVKQLGPDEFYVYAIPANKAQPPFLWFHWRVDGCAGKELTFHVNPAPFGQLKTGGNGARLPVLSYDGDHWEGVADKSWNQDGTALTFKQRFTRSPAWIASFFPYTPAHVTRVATEFGGHPCFKADSMGKTAAGRAFPRFTIADPAGPANRPAILFTALHHDLETTGAMALEGLCRFLLSDDAGAVRLRRKFVFYVFPMIDPDGIAAGNMYFAQGNLNRQWGLNTAPQITLVEKFARQLTTEGRTIELFMDFHGWCTPERTTQFMTFGEPLADAESARDAMRLVDAIKPKLQGKTYTKAWTTMVSRVTMGDTDLRRMSCGWIKFEGPARLAYSIEIFGEASCTQDEYLAWGRSFGQGIAEFYGK